MISSMSISNFVLWTTPFFSRPIRIMHSSSNSQQDNRIKRLLAGKDYICFGSTEVTTHSMSETKLFFVFFHYKAVKFSVQCLFSCMGLWMQSTIFHFYTCHFTNPTFNTGGSIKHSHYTMLKIHLQLPAFSVILLQPKFYIKTVSGMIWNNVFFPCFQSGWWKLPFLHNLLPSLHLGNNLLSSTNLPIHLLISMSLCK